MRAVLGIDAAWTASQPSGVALISETAAGWTLIAAEASYEHFISNVRPANRVWSNPTGSMPDVLQLLTSASARLDGREVDLAAVDMPLSHDLIEGRRCSDNAVSTRYGKRHCSTHSPNAERPGKISDELTKSFKEIGYELQTMEGSEQIRGLIEVYPHPALVELAKEQKRLPYKASKVARYWRNETVQERRSLLYDQWDRIAALLESEISGVLAKVPRLQDNASVKEKKAREDVLDAIICAWVGACVLEGKAEPFGNSKSAIWIPRPSATVAPS